MTDQHILYGGELSYFTGKARAYLNWKGVDYEERLATRDIYTSVIIPRIGYPMIPLLITPDDEAIQDTTEIIDHFENLKPAPSVYPSGPKQRLAAHLLELYGDEWLVIPAMHYRWTHNRDFAFREFGKVVAPQLAGDAQLEAGKKAAEKFLGVVPFLGATPAMAPAIEASYLSLLNELDAHFKTHEFLFGSRPSIGDFGLIGPLYAHQYRDPNSGALMKERAPNVGRWVEQMQSPAAPLSGAFLENDEVPETLEPILRRMMREQGPCLEDLTQQLAQWKNDNPGTNIPRMIGTHEFSVEGETGQRIMLPYTQWMLQRAKDHFGDLAGADRKTAQQLLDEIGGGFFATLPIEAPVRRERHQLVWANS